MSVQRLERGGRVRYRARVKFHGREVATQVFDRKRDALAWEEEQTRRLRTGEWIDPRRGRVPLSQIADDWLASRSTVKRRTRESDEAAWRNYIAPRFGNWPASSLTSGEVLAWVGQLVTDGKAPATATRALATLRSILNFGMADGRLHVNVAAAVRSPRAGADRREGYALTYDELHRLRALCAGPQGPVASNREVAAELVLVLGLTGMRWGELAGLHVGDLVTVPGRGLRLQRTVLASGGGGELYVDTLKNRRSRTVPLVEELHELVDRRAAGRAATDWLFPAPAGGPMRESNWKRLVGWTKAVEELGYPTLRVHDLRHTAASLWLGSGADPKVVQAVLGHATAAMTMDVYGHLIAANLWEAARRVGGSTGGTTGAHAPSEVTRIQAAKSPAGL
ncbi:site-specific recombinase XerD [Kineococcus xinjiangensis]|uniref:Site-specific recombinase XerD n=1 Tax=Kineococcus xinjiangensis TaxID=512762 RepID=A0A2S6IFH0_9ACTN|nr:site-specific integrase [Kineococcus xinjiangensis]PPK92947.1 site-specific recombinase XerD [Kineococcus xinjiangensis]